MANLLEFKGNYRNNFNVSNCRTFTIYMYSYICSGSVDGNNQLIIRGRFNQKQIENVLRRYISKYCSHTEA